MANNHPPELFLRFLKWFCDPDLHLMIEGDLIELYEERRAESSKKIADWRFAIDVIFLFRPRLIRSFSFFSKITSQIMLQHNLLISWRNLKRQQQSSIINLVGLVSGLTCALFVFLWVRDEIQFDKFHANDAHLYQVLQNLPHTDEVVTITGTPGPLAQTLMETMPEVEVASTVIPPEWLETKGVLSFKGNRLKATAQVADKNYLRLFTIGIIQGSKDQQFVEPQTVMISDHLATKLFGQSQNAIGEMIEWEQEYFSGLYVITGVFVSPPAHSTQRFDLLFDYQSFYDKHASNLGSWGNSGPDTYLLLRTGTDVQKFNDKIKDLRRTKYAQLIGSEYLEQVGTLFIQRYSDRYLYSRFENGIQSGGRISYVKLFILIGILILIVACINFMNLATAKATLRMREIGIKKAVGASRRSLIFQFLTESTLLAFLAAFISVGLVYVLLPEFNSIAGKQIDFKLSPFVFLCIMAITLFTGIIAGSYPAIYLSASKPSTILRDKSINSIRDFGVRRSLVVLQFTVSIVLLVAMLVVGKQIDFIHSTNLGYNRDNIMVFDWEGEENVEPFLNDLKDLPGIVQTSTFGHDMVGDYGGTGAVNWTGKPEGHPIQFANLEVDYDWIELMKIEILEGRTYSRDFGDETDKIIFNETAIRAMGLEDPIGKTVTLWGKERQIIAVAKDFNFASLYEEIKPCFIQCYPNLTHVLIKIKGGQERETIAHIEDAYDTHVSGLPFEYRFIDDDYQALYASEKRVARLSKYFAGLTIIISCLGLFGLALFTTEQRTKEIGIRKVLGATSFNIVMMFSKDVVKMIIITIIIALPLSYVMMSNWLVGFSYRIDLGWSPFILSAVLTLFVAWVSISWQSLRAAMTSPAETLRSD